MQSVGLYHSFSIWVKRDKKNLEISTCEERAFFSSISIDGKKKACRSTRQKSIDFIFFMSTSWYMKPIVLFSSSLSKHHFTFGNLFRWNNTNEFVSIQIIQYQFFWPTRKREMERYAVEIEKRVFVLWQTIWTSEEIFWYLLISNHRDVWVLHVNHEFDRRHSSKDEQEQPKSSQKITILEKVSIESFYIHHQEMYTIEPYHIDDCHRLAYNLRHIDEEPKW